MNKQENRQLQNLPLQTKAKILQLHCFCNEDWPTSERYKLRTLSKQYKKLLSERVSVCVPGKLCREELRHVRNEFPKLRGLDLTGTEWRQLQLETADNLFRSKVITIKAGDQINDRFERQSHPAQLANEINQFECLDYIRIEDRQCHPNLDFNKLKIVSLSANSPQVVYKLKRRGQLEYQSDLHAMVQVRNYSMTDSAHRLALQFLREWTRHKVELELEMHGFLEDTEEDRSLLLSQWKMLREDFNLVSLQLRLSGACHVCPTDLGILIQNQPCLERLDISLDGAEHHTLNLWKAPVKPQILSSLNNIPYFNLCVGNHVQLLKQVIKNGLTGLGGVSTSKAGDTPEGIEQILRCIIYKLPNLRCYRDEQFGVLGLKKMIQLDQISLLSEKLVKLHLHCFIAKNDDDQVGNKLLKAIGKLTQLQVLELSCVTKMQNGNRQNYVFQCDLGVLKNLKLLRCLQLKSIKFEDLNSNENIQWLKELKQLNYLDLSIGYGGGDDLVVLNQLADRLYQKLEKKLKKVRFINLRLFPIGD